MTDFKRWPRRFLSRFCTFLKDFCFFAVKEPANTPGLERCNTMKRTLLLVCGGVCLLLVLPLRAQPVLHQIGNILSDGNAVTLSFAGSVSNMFDLPPAVSNQFMQMFDLYPVDASSDLGTWARQAVLLRTNSSPAPLLYQETNLASERFYRTPTNHFLTGFPGPTGPFSVGTIVRVLTDSSRSNRYGLNTNSSFMSTFWYPAAQASASDFPRFYWDPAVARDGSFYSFFAWPIQWTNIMVACVTHAFAELTPLPGTNRFPLILYSHGYACDRAINSHLAAELASHGYIVAAVDHEDCHATVYPDARGVRYVPPGSFTDFAALAKSRTNDFEYLLSHLAELNATDPVLAGRLDAGRVATLGWSAGGGTAAELARIDSRIKCSALLDPYLDQSAYYPELYQRGLQKPFLTMNSTIQTHPGPPFESQLFAVSSNLFTLGVTNATWFQIANIGHTALSDLAWSMDMTTSSRNGSVVIDATVLWFFETYLKDTAAVFPTNTAILNLRTK